ncbi:hypothetical protein NPIL_377101 [Nephila pilipes]|uniref:Uncharacterized protein n=1 Tax=Nephila pilipes TaxID=299642 RepID=A0A8X6PQ72_NEPPI|nr:hypothetical protein NPIL_377101 [Nephila pilipes]
MPTDEAIEIANFTVEEISLKYDATREMICNKGRSFLSNIVRAINQSCQTSHLLTTDQWFDRKFQLDISSHRVHIRIYRTKKLGQYSILCNLRV